MVVPGQSSVRKGDAGRPSLLCRLQAGLSAQAYLTATESGTARSCTTPGARRDAYKVQGMPPHSKKMLPERQRLFVFHCQRRWFTLMKLTVAPAAQDVRCTCDRRRGRGKKGAPPV